ncbi:hypothetical protein ATG_15430 [Desulfurococcaceae archaeon AG1]|nr:hypothetical protein ATG_15430 [Desulfurococcaceae archaeon AG1]
MRLDEVDEAFNSIVDLPRDMLGEYADVVAAAFNSIVDLHRHRHQGQGFSHIM